MQVVEREITAPVRAKQSTGANGIYQRLERYLFALGIQDEAARHRAIQMIQDRVAIRKLTEPATSECELAAAELDHMLEEWWQQICASGTSESVTICHEDLALFVANLPPEGQCCFPNALPENFKKAARTPLRPHPDLQRAAMIPQPLDLGPITRLVALQRNPFFKVATGAAWLFGLIVAVMFIFQHL